MSMDFVLYTACAISVPVDLPQPSAWKEEQFGWSYDGGSWLIRIGTESDAEIPNEASNLVPDVDNSTTLVVEGSVDSAGDFLGSVVMTVLGKCGGGVIESNTGFDKVKL